MTNTDVKRVFDGFTSLEAGMDSNSSPSLLPPNQAAFLGNMSLRGNFPRTRPNFVSRILNYEDSTTQSHFDGLFQGACFYEAMDDEVLNSLLVSIGGRLFRIFIGNKFLVKEITPGPPILVTSNFTVPAVDENVTVDVSSETPFSVGQDIVIADGSYTVMQLLSDQLVLSYNGGGLNANGTINSTTPILDSAGVQTYVTLPELVTTYFNVPLPGSSITVDVTSEKAFTVGQNMTIDSGIYTVTQTLTGQLVLVYIIGAAHTYVAANTPIYLAAPMSPVVTVLASFTVPGIGASVDIKPSSHLATFSINQVVLIDGGYYLINDLAYRSIKTTYQGGSSVSSVSAGDAFYVPTGTALNVTLPETVTLDFAIPALNSDVVIHVTDETGFTPTEQLIIADVNFTVASVVTGQKMINATYTGGALYVAASTPVLNDSNNPVYLDDTNPPDADYVFLYQGENYAFGLCENQGTIFFDGSTARRASPSQNELPSSYVGVYAWGRNWLAQVNGHRFVASDLVGDPSGSPALVYVDAILKMTENDLLNGGGAFSTPSNLGLITAMGVLSQLDSSLGIGPVLVGTRNSIFSVQAPVDRTTWQNLTYPIQSVALQGSGPTGPRSMISVNSDAWFRSLDGARSLMAARRDFNSNRSNTPNSLEMNAVFDLDDESLLYYSSLAIFDNRIFFTASPYQTPYGVAHRGLAVINQDDISSINKEGNMIWEGLWTGLNVLQILTGNLNGKNRCFAFVLNASNGIDLWELLSESEEGVYDVFDEITGGSEVLNNTSIKSWLDTRAMSFGDAFQLKKLIMAELYLDEIVDNVMVKVYFKPDQYPLWTLWTTINVCANVSQCSFQGTSGGNCVVWQTQLQQYGARLRLPRAPESCNNITGQPMDRGYEFQFRLEITGNCRIRKFKAHALMEQDAMEGECPPSVSCKTLSGCETSWFGFSSYP